MIRLIILTFFIFQFTFLFSQTTLNMVDSLGRKKGFWQKKDSTGKIVYEATFLNDKPIGKMTRFHSNGKKKAELIYDQANDSVIAVLFNEKGEEIASGIYIDQKKDGDWEYYKEGRLISSEHYMDGVKSGMSLKYYPSGELLEKMGWYEGKQDGAYVAYFKDGTPYLICEYENGFREGEMKSFYMGGSLEMELSYKQDMRDGDCIFYNQDGTIAYTLKYDMGVLLNPEVQDSIENAEFEGFTRKDVPDPEKFMQYPEEYMRKIYQGNR